MRTLNQLPEKRHYSVQSLIAWVNVALQSNFKSLEEFQNGVVYGRILKRFYDGTAIDKMSGNASTMDQIIKNYEMLINELQNLDMNYSLDVEDFVFFNFIPHYCFLHWLYESCVTKDLAKLQPEKDQSQISAISGKAGNAALPNGNEALRQCIEDCQRITRNLKDHCVEKLTQYKALIAHNDSVSKERDFYYNALLSIQSALSGHIEDKDAKVLIEIIGDTPLDFLPSA